MHVHRQLHDTLSTSDYNIITTQRPRSPVNMQTHISDNYVTLIFDLLTSE